jgi:anthranilate phosphoribosyltransferase
MIATQLERLFRGEELSEEAINGLFDAMLGGRMEPPHVAALLTAWRMRGESADELAIGAAHLRKHAAQPSLDPALRPLADNCGTGGDGANTFNISTGAAVVAAASGARIAKHGNRSVSSRSGSADLLFEAGFPQELSADAAVALLSATGLTFFFAPNFHPVMRHVGPVRKALGVRTIFNLLGPLANPLAPEVQLVGVGSRSQTWPMAEALRRLGTKRALVVHSRDGLDEISPAATTDYVLLDNGRLSGGSIDPDKLGIDARRTELAGGDAKHNRQLLDRVLDNDGGGLGAAVALNAGALLWLTGAARDLAAGYATARGTLASGAAKSFFHGWIARARSLA